MSKLKRAGLEAIIAIAITVVLGLGGAFAMMFSIDQLVAMYAIFYAAWAAGILISHLALAGRKRAWRLGVGLVISCAVMGTHLAMYLMGNIATDIHLIPVILYDFGCAVVTLIALSIVHLVIFRQVDSRAARALQTAPALATPASPTASERVADLPEPQGATTTPVDSAAAVDAPTGADDPTAADSTKSPQNA